MTGQLAAVYRDSTIWTTSPGRENLRPVTGTLQKHIPTLTRTAINPTIGPLGARYQSFDIMIDHDLKKCDKFI
jgi:hypothetical protein